MGVLLGLMILLLAVYASAYVGPPAPETLPNLQQNASSDTDPQQIHPLLSPKVLKVKFCYLKNKADMTRNNGFHMKHKNISMAQVHVSLIGENQMRITWITNDTNVPSVVEYGTSPGAYNSSAKGENTSYTYLGFRSGQIHYVILGPLEANTIYYYRCGTYGPEYSFKTPRSQFPITFAIVGDLGQTGQTNSTLQHIQQTNYDVLLLPGDLSFADTQQPLWDSFGMLVQPLASTRPWMVTEGEEEIETIPIVVTTEFIAYNARWRMPFEESGSSSNLYYSFEVAGVHIVMLGSFAKYKQNSDQYEWLQADLSRVNKTKTPWIIVLFHVPWYNSNAAHRGEGDDMRAAMEPLLYGAKVDIAFAGHIHAYERFSRVYMNTANVCGAVHITIGDGGGTKSLDSDFLDPQPQWSLFREASFGHGELTIYNATHAQWRWHRNDDNASTIADESWINNLSLSSNCTVEH